MQLGMGTTGLELKVFGAAFSVEAQFDRDGFEEG
jgi:hypothetical protein